MSLSEHSIILILCSLQLNRKNYQDNILRVLGIFSTKVDGIILFLSCSSCKGGISKKAKFIQQQHFLKCVQNFILGIKLNSIKGIHF